MSSTNCRLSFYLWLLGKKFLSFLILILWNLYLAVTFIECRVSSSYFFLFFGLPPIFSFFFMKFQVFLIFKGFTGYTETFWSIWNKIANKIDKFYKKLKLHVKKDQFEAFLRDFFVSNEIWNLVIVVGWVVPGNMGGNTCFCLHGNAFWMYAMVPVKY